MIISHGKCGKSWTGAGRAHCGACHETFSSLGAFDAHQRGPHVPAGQLCADPEDLGLVQIEKPWGFMWGYEADPEGFTWLKK